MLPHARLLRRSTVKLPIVVVFALVMAALAACRATPVATEFAHDLDGGRAFHTALIIGAADSSAATDSVDALAFGYLERARLGLGSPFRLVDFVLDDPRLPPTERERTAWAVLAMVYDRSSHVVDPAALDSIFVASAANGAGAGQLHLDVIDSAMSAAADPAVAEAAVRLAYVLGGAERIIRSNGVASVVRAAAQIRDREVARRDLIALLREARDMELSPLRLLPTWRLARRFEVESPRLAVITPEKDGRAVEHAAGLLEQLRENAHSRLAMLVPEALESTGMAAMPAPVGGTLARMGSVLEMPPQAPVIVAVSTLRHALVSEQGIGAAEQAARARFVARARNEETFVAEYALLGPEPGTQPALLALWAATTLRPYAQEKVWFPGWGGPTASDLRARFGIASVTFDSEVPAVWRPYFLRMLGTATQDLLVALPGVDLTGLRVHFNHGDLRKNALAVHDPRTRTVHLPLNTGAGAIAHELAHDLDWQTSARVFARRGDYSTDQAVREQRGKLAATVRGLTSATLVPPTAENGFQASHSQRPTEVFASSVDWYVAAAIASEGRVNGYLTSVQDEVLTGYAAVTPPDVHGESGEATVAVLREMTTLAPSTRDWFLEKYGRGRTVTAYDVMLRVLELAAPAATIKAPAGSLAVLPASSFPSCHTGQRTSTDRTTPHERIAVLAAESAARRTVARRGLPMPAGGAFVRIRSDLGAGPWDPALVSAEVARVRNQILARAAALNRPPGLLTSQRGYLPGC